MDILVRLYWSFVKIGFSSFGGMSMIPQISAEMLSNGWMNAAQVNDIVAIAEMTPGPLGFNCATFAGIQAAGIPGALAANLGAATPALTLGMLAAACFQKFKSSSFLQRAMVGIRPVCTALVLGVLVGMLRSNYRFADRFDAAAAAISVLDMVLILRYKWSAARVLGISAALGLLLFGVLGW